MKKKYVLPIIIITLYVNQIVNAQCGPNKVAMHICINHKCQSQCLDNSQVSYYQSMGYILGKCPKNNACIGPFVQKEYVVFDETAFIENQPKSFLNIDDIRNSNWQIENNYKISIITSKDESFVVNSYKSCICSIVGWGCRDWDFKCREHCFKICNH